MMINQGSSVLTWLVSRPELHIYHFGLGPINITKIKWRSINNPNPIDLWLIYLHMIFLRIIWLFWCWFQGHFGIQIKIYWYERNACILVLGNTIVVGPNLKRWVSNPRILSTRQKGRIVFWMYISYSLDSSFFFSYEELALSIVGLTVTKDDGWHLRRDSWLIFQALIASQRIWCNFQPFT